MYYDKVMDKLWQKDFFKGKKMQEAILGGKGKPKTKLPMARHNFLILGTNGPWEHKRNHRRHN